MIFSITNMTFAEFQASLQSKKFHPAYFIFGPDPFLVAQAQRKLAQALEQQPEGAINCVVCDLADSSLNELIGLAQNIPMFAPRQMLLVRGIEKIRESQAAGLVEYLKNPSPFSTLVFLAGELDRDDKKKKIYQLLEKSTYVVELSLPRESEVKSWITAKLKAAGMVVEPGAVDFLVETQGTEMGRLSNEVEKLALLAANGGKVTVEMATESVGFSREHTVFEFLNAVAAKDKNRALRLAAEMMADSGQALGMLSLLGRQLRQWLQVKELAGRMRPDELGKQIGVYSQSIVNKMINQSRQFSRQSLVQALCRLGMVDDRIKRSALDTQVFVEWLIHDLTR